MLGNMIDVEKVVVAIPKERVDISVVVYVDKHMENATQMYAYVANLLVEEGKSYEFIFVDDGNGMNISTAIEGLQRFVKKAKVVRMPRYYGPSTAMMVGFRHAKGDLIMTLGSFLQVQPKEIKKMLKKLDEGYDFVNGWRVGRHDTKINQWHTKFYNWLVRKALQVDIHDTNCTLKLFKRKVADELPLHGDYYRFIPVLASRQGFRVAEIPVEQRRELNSLGLYSFGVYVRRFLDLLALLFMGRFIRKPLRFFGLVGSLLFASGFLIDLYLTYLKYFESQPISHRPLLVLGTLFMVLGVQSASIGLIGELIIFTHAQSIKDYQIETILG